MCICPTGKRPSLRRRGGARVWPYDVGVAKASPREGKGIASPPIHCNCSSESHFISKWSQMAPAPEVLKTNDLGFHQSQGNMTVLSGGCLLLCAVAQAGYVAKAGITVRLSPKGASRNNRGDRACAGYRFVSYVTYACLYLIR